MMEISKKMVLCALLALTMLVTAFAGEKVVEKVSVDWWVIPFFAVDSSGKSITQLTEQDIQLKVDGKVVENFTIVKKDFSVPGELKAAPQNAKTQPVPERKKNVFMLFDTAVSSKEATVKSKAIARKIIKNSAKGTRFFILTIEPFAGLVYTGGGTDNKSQLLRIIDKEVKEKNNSRLPMASDIIADTGGKHSKYDEQDLAFLTSRAGQIHVRRSKSFLRSFESLYYTLNGIKDNKFVYLFSEGISNAVRDRVRGAYSVFTEYLKDVAGYLGRSGAVLFIINPYGSNTPGDSTTSGEDSLKIMAHNSGGKYLEGNDKVILEKINHIHQAYYEIFFRSKIQSKSGMMAIDITSKRKGIEVHSMKATERARKYPEMKKVEREVMVLNLVTANPLYKAGVNSKAATIKKTSKKKKSVTYMVELPQEQLGQKVDLYKIRYDEKGGNTRVGVEALSIGKKKLKITFDGVKKDDKTYFVLVNGAQGTALVHGMKSVTKKPLPVNLSGQSESEWSSRKDMEKELRDMKPEKGAELQKLLEGAAGYCEKLKKAAFHYTCKEKIVETLKPFTRVSNIDKDIAKSGIDRNQVLHIQAPRRSMNAIRNDKYVFNYLLLKKGQNVKEDRDLLSMKLSKNEKGKAKKDTEAIIKGIRFLSRKAVFGPITLLSAERQAKYNFRLLNYAKLKGRKVAVIEALPKKENAAIFLYGKIWLDTGDFSILKIKANPNSILGYKKLLDLAGELNARLRLNLETEFYKLREGIRFPTMVRFDENYKGGTFITQHMGTKGWERSKTIINYVKYLFYNVGVDVSYE